MLKLNNIVKVYSAGDTDVTAIKGISIEFRKNEFVSVLGPSGCGKTTLLNIIGGLDRYTSGDLSIGGKSTEKFTDRDWDTYRNHSIGFVFQSYNLIPHQSVLSNVELALTLSGVSKSERRARALKVLEQVGLSDQIHKKPNQMSGGQMQRVAIARALVNDPEILLADEPTGALDSTTSVQIMELLRSISKDRLIIMVTHNPELAEKYSTRIVRLLDGKIQSDSNPYTSSDEDASETTVKKKAVVGKKDKSTMSFITAMSLSFNNLLTKKARTFLTSFAGSIGIIGIALILSISSGFQAYISALEKDTLSSYPITIQRESIDLSDMIVAMSGSSSSDRTDHEDDKIYSNNMMTEMMSYMTSNIQSNDLDAFKKFIESPDSGFTGDLISDIQYTYNIKMNIYSSYTSSGIYQINPSSILSNIMASTGAMTSSYNVWSEMLNNQKLLSEQYDVVAGRWPSAYNEVVVVIDKNNEISDIALYSLGLMDPQELNDLISAIQRGEEYRTEVQSFTYDEILATTFRLVLESDYYTDTDGDGVWEDRREDTAYMLNLVNNAEEIKVVGIVRQSENATAASISGVIGYTSQLSKHIIEKVNSSAIVLQQISDPETDVFSGIKFDTSEYQPTIEDFYAYYNSLSEEAKAMIEPYISGKSDAEILSMFAEQLKPETTSATYDGNISKLGVVDMDSPASISIYAANFDAKEQISDIIASYNQKMIDSGHEEGTISYTDYIGLVLSSVSTAINAISYVLIAFVGISLVVSSIMIGIITYISVLERTKEIGVLRSIGASKRDVSRVFTAETLIIGFASGIIGILVTIILDIPVNIIIKALAGINNVAALPVSGAIILVLISMALTLIAGLIPSRLAAKKDPVIALRSE